MTRKSTSLGPVVLVVFACTTGCQSQQRATEIQADSAAQSKPEMIAEFHSLLAKSGKIKFRSLNGEWFGTDCDTDIIFLPGDAVAVMEYRYVDVSYKGTYHLGDDGAVSLRLVGLNTAWPAMALARDAKSLLLRPQDSKLSPASSDHLRGRYWPFRVIP